MEWLCQIVNDKVMDKENKEGQQLAYCIEG